MEVPEEEVEEVVEVEEFTTEEEKEEEDMALTRRAPELHLRPRRHRLHLRLLFQTPRGDATSSR